MIVFYKRTTGVAMFSDNPAVGRVGRNVKSLRKEETETGRV